MWTEFTEILYTSPNLLSVSDRAHLLDDAFNFAEAQLLNYQVALDLSKYLYNETDYVPWSVGASNLLKLHSLLKSSNVYETYNSYIQDLVENAYSYVTWNIVSSDKNHCIK